MANSNFSFKVGDVVRQVGVPDKLFKILEIDTCQPVELKVACFESVTNLWQVAEPPYRVADLFYTASDDDLTLLDD